MSREQEQGSLPRRAEALPRLGVVGIGAVGTTLAWGLAARGYPVVALAGRTPAAARWLAGQLSGCRAASSPAEVADLADLVILAVPDDALPSIAASLPWRPGQAAVHCSGASPASVLASASQRGALAGSFHPLVSIPRARPTSAADALARLAGCTFAIEAPAPLAALLEAMARRLSGRAVFLQEQDRVPYHLAAVLVSNYTVALVAAATDLWARFGVAREEALVALLPLLRSTVANLDQLGLPESLTGPIVRGDLGTVHAHLAYLMAQEPDTLPDTMLLGKIYRALGLLSLPVARARGRLSEAQEAALRRLLSDTTDGEAAISQE